YGRRSSGHGTPAVLPRRDGFRGRPRGTSRPPGTGPNLSQPFSGVDTQAPICTLPQRLGIRSATGGSGRGAGLDEVVDHAPELPADIDVPVGPDHERQAAVAVEAAPDAAPRHPEGDQDPADQEPERRPHDPLPRI